MSPRALLRAIFGLDLTNLYITVTLTETFVYVFCCMQALPFCNYFIINEVKHKRGRPMLGLTQTVVRL